jgi:hypothetical protein
MLSTLEKSDFETRIVWDTLGSVEEQVHYFNPKQDKNNAFYTREK